MTSVAVSTIRKWRADPVAFVRECFKVEPDEWQKDVLAAFPTTQRQAMKACKGPGKSAVLAWLAWNFLSTRPHPKIVCTSITGDNLRDGLWTEMAKWMKRSPFLDATFEWRRERITSREHPETWWMSARQWSKAADTTTQGETLAGLHADNMMFILDEAGGIPDAVAAAAEAGLANVVDPQRQEAHLLLAGNPYMLEGPLYRACTRERHLWSLTEITADPDDPKRTPRVSVDWARQQIEKFGRDNPWVLVNVFGKFPPGSLNALLGPDDVNPCLGRHILADHYLHAPKILGIDVARFGDDRTILLPRQGIVAFPPVTMRGARTEAIAARAAQAIVKWKPDAVFIDGTGGYGAGVIDALRLGNFEPIEVQFAGKANDPRYLNKRAEMWFEMAEWIKGGGVALPDLPELVAELTSPTYMFSNGRFQIEPKDQIKIRLGYSPDIADALALTFAQQVLPKDLHRDIAQGSGSGHAVTEYQPVE